MPPPAGEACQLNAKTFHKMKMTTSGLQGVVENLNNSLKVSTPRLRRTRPASMSTAR